MARCDGDIVKKAEAHGTVWRGVMARWTNEGKGRGDLTGQDSIYTGNSSTGGAHGRLEGVGRHIGIGVEEAAVLYGGGAHKIDFLGCVHGENLVEGRWRRRNLNELSG